MLYDTIKQYIGQGLYVVVVDEDREKPRMD